MPLTMLVYPLFDRFLLRALTASLVLAAGSAWAVRSDRDQPLAFAADAARVDEAQKLNVLSGNVEITKGTMVVRSDRVEVRQNPDGTQSASAFGGAGGKAFFRQQREGTSDEFIEGEAERLDYDGKSDTVRFTTRAVMRRLHGARVTDEVSGQTIVYDNKTSVFQVLGGNTATAPGSTPGRVRGVITPRSAEPAASAAATPPAAPTSPQPAAQSTAQPTAQPAPAKGAR